MQILGIIPARSGSKSVPGKNIKMLAGVSLIAYTIAAAKRSKLITELILSSDSEEIISIATKYGANAPFKRPESLANDETPSIDVIKHALFFFAEKGKNFEAVCLLQPTSPFRTETLIDRCIEKFVATKADTLFTAIKVPHQYNPHWIFEKDANENLHVATGESEIISQRQKLPPAFIRDGAVYIIKTDTILQQNTLYGKNISFIETNEHWHTNIDSEEDWVKAEKKATEYLQQFPFE